MSRANEADNHRNRRHTAGIGAHIGWRMRLRRKELDQTEETLADMMGVSRSTVSRYETGRLHLSASTLYRAALALGVEVDYFFSGLACGAACERKSTVRHRPRSLPPSPWETRALIRHFSRIKSPVAREQLLDLVRSVAKSKNYGDAN
ncbi:MAG: helix-turn-helix domain-containing protein [Rhodospirillales bacterium]|nr:helix-turn-helix domain-containing protein [Rhodospirillales bacterium]MCW8861164.1 helix-turn-helix domain-containing protein [Rhodospirillales bacterium]MCW8953270.1 helix-turn-helix domain-containing protein [Rhodospirillales bacterium]MCW8970890.1 helix-turn-helix domain-containing protein [Rhodospirillales bacterium]MCW9001633.1 helix-turn-helix domain-containing protein [Rhodospirillales bacterium]